MFARGNSTTTDRKNTSPCPSALLDARLKTICWRSETCRTRPVAVLEKIGICAVSARRAAAGSTVVLICLALPLWRRRPDAGPPLRPCRTCARTSAKQSARSTLLVVVAIAEAIDTQRLERPRPVSSGDDPARQVLADRRRDRQAADVAPAGHVEAAGARKPVDDEVPVGRHRRQPAAQLGDRRVAEQRAARSATSAILRRSGSMSNSRSADLEAGRPLRRVDHQRVGLVGAEHQAAAARAHVHARVHDADGGMRGRRPRLSGSVMQSWWRAGKSGIRTSGEPAEDARPRAGGVDDDGRLDARRRRCARRGSRAPSSRKPVTSVFGSAVPPRSSSACTNARGSVAGLLDVDVGRRRS